MTKDGVAIPHYDYDANGNRLTAPNLTASPVYDAQERLTSYGACTYAFPAGQMEYFEPCQVVEFDPEACGPCALRDSCTLSASGKGRLVHLAEDEALQDRFRKLQATRAGRSRLRKG